MHLLKITINNLLQLHADRKKIHLAKTQGLVNIFYDNDIYVKFI